MRRIKDKGPLTFTMLVALLIALRQFLEIYHFTDQGFALGMVGLLCLFLWVLPHWSLRFIGGIGIYAVTVYHYFPLGQSFGGTWLAALWRQLRPLLTMVREEGFGRTPSLLAFSLVFLAVCLIAVLGIEYEVFSLSYLSLLGYFLLLSIFNHLEVLSESLIIVLCGLLAAGFRHFRSVGGTAWLRYVLLGGGLLGLLYFAAVNLPDAWVRDPLASHSVTLRNRLNEAGLYNFVAEVGVGGNTRTGFGEDDEVLGGALVDDSTVLFRATQDSPHYWRVDSKDQYTGKGWLQHTTDQPQVIEGANFTVTHSETENFLHRQEIELTFESLDTYLPLPYGNSQITLNSGFSGFVYFENSQRVNLLVNEEKTRELSMLSAVPEFPVSALQQVGVTQGEDFDSYLRLPGSLPQRVADLAKELTQDAVTMYDKVNAIESYLNSSPEFRYSKVDVVAPLLDQDYVDQFLFESKVGYCDNFSTAMVVMLRTLGIPARWAKGFSPGTAIPSFEERKTYEIKNLNAHSWPEVYFAGYGWIPFEPTPSFTNPARPGTPEEEVASSSVASSEVTEASTTTTTTQSSESQGSTSETSQVQNEQDDEDSTATTSRKISWLVLGLLLVIGALVVYRYGAYWGMWLLCRFTAHPLAKGYPYLLRHLERRIPRKSGETLLAYSEKVIAQWPELAALMELTRRYESSLYGGQKETTDSRELLLTVMKELPKKR